LKIGLVGAGRFGKNHVRTLHEMGVLAGIAELDPETRKAAAEQTGARAVEDFRELLTEMDAFVVATPVHTHFAIAKDILNAGKPVMVEKPITLSVTEAEELVALAKSKSLPLMVGHLLIYQPAIRWIKNALEEELIGDVVSVHQERLNLGLAVSVRHFTHSSQLCRPESFDPGSRGRHVSPS
jgi:predicted dehydrogenase